MTIPAYRVRHHYYADVRVRLAGKDHEVASETLDKVLAAIKSQVPAADVELLKDMVQEDETQ